MKEILAIIPARAGSKRIPNKNVIDLAGKPLIYYNINAAKNSKYITRIIVSTDGEEISRISKSFGAEVLMRPAELATDTAKTLLVLQHVVNYLKEKENYYPEIVVLLQPDSPLKTSEDIDKVIEKILTGNYDSTISVGDNSHSPEWLLVEEGDEAKFYFGDIPTKIRKQDLKKTYFIDGLVYVMKTYQLMKNEHYVLGGKIGMVILDKSHSFEIDTYQDLEIVRALMEHENNKNRK